MDYYFLKIKSKNIASISGINDVPLVRDALGEGVTTLCPINEWILPTGNIVSFDISTSMLHTGGSPATTLGENDSPDTQNSLHPDNEPEFNATVFLADPDKNIPEPIEIIFDYSWPGDAEDNTLPLSIKAPIDIYCGRPPLPVTLWKDAEQLTEITPSDKFSLVQLISQLQDILVASDGEGAFSMLAYRYADLARAMGHPPERIHDAVLEQYSQMFGINDKTALSINQTISKFELVAGSRVVYISRNARKITRDEFNDPDKELYPQSAIIFDTPNGFLGIEIYAAKIKGSWMIVRT